MSFRFFRRKTLFPGVTLNFSKSGVSASIGPRGAKVTIGPKGIRTTLGLPGTGLHWTQHFSYSSAPNGRSTINDDSSEETATPISPGSTDPESSVSENSIQGRFTLIDQKFIDAIQMIDDGDDDKAIGEFVSIAKLCDDVDAAFLAGVLLLRNQRPAESEPHLVAAAQGRWRLGNHLRELRIETSIEIEISDNLRATIEPNYRGVLIALAETLQALGRHQEAIEQLQSLLRVGQNDPIVRLCIVELLTVEGRKESNWKTAVRLASVSTVESQEIAPTILSGLSYFRGIAYKQLGQLRSAKDSFLDAMKASPELGPEFDDAVRGELAELEELEKQCDK